MAVVGSEGRSTAASSEGEDEYVTSGGELASSDLDTDFSADEMSKSAAKRPSKPTMKAAAFAETEKDTPGTVNGVDRNSFIFRRKKQEGGSKAGSEQKTSTEAEAQNTETKTEEKGLLSKLSDAMSSIKTRLFG